ncbi:MAG: ABC transporter ATP-binding protein [Immundisolibacterales bacterium]|nr:ABC transporter ATP-binding protein [Immundisolibacterales bacterium]
MVLRFLDVEKHYAVSDQRVPALNGVSLDVGEGEWVALVGRSGCGKTTLLNLAGAADLPTRGEVEIEGVRTSSLDDDALTELRRHKIGFVFQFLQLLPTLSAVENVELPLQLAGVRRARPRAREMLGRVGIAELADRHPHQLSGGQMQRVAIARALVHEPSLLLADEPTGSLDDEAAGSVMELLLDLRRQLGTSILMATHSLEVAAVSDRRLILRDGKLIAGEEPGGL